MSAISNGKAISQNDISPINMVKARKIFTEFEPEVLYDVLHDHEYRTTWDDAMIEARRTTLVPEVFGILCNSSSGLVND